MSFPFVLFVRFVVPLWGRDMLRRFVQYWVGKVVARPLHRKFAAFEAACQDPQRTQDELLRSIVEFHRDTDFGKDHGFAAIRTVAAGTSTGRPASSSAMRPTLRLSSPAWLAQP